MLSHACYALIGLGVLLALFGDLVAGGVLLLAGVALHSSMGH